MKSMYEIKRDTARFDSRQWYIEGGPGSIGTMPWFSTKEDAQAALSLAGMMVADARQEFAIEVKDFIDSKY
jgi:hypothetical protein